MKLFEMIIEDGEHVFKSTRPAKDEKQLRSIYGGNGEFVRIKDVTEYWKNYMFSVEGLDGMRRTLARASYGSTEIDIIIALMQTIN